MTNFSSFLLSTLLTLICSIITLLIYSYSFRRYTKKSKLIYYPNDPIRLNSDLTKVFNSFQIKVNDKPITDNIVYLSGTLICADRDLITSDNDISLTLPEGCEWLECQVTKSNTNIDAIIQTVGRRLDSPNSNCAIIHFDKLRANDSLTIKAIVKGNNRLIENYAHEIKLNSHIPNTDVELFWDNKKSFFSIHVEKIALLSIVLLIIGSLLVYTSNVLPNILKSFIYFVVVTGLIVYIGIICVNVQSIINKRKKDNRIKAMNTYKVKGQRKFS